MKTPEEILLRQLDNLSYHIIGALRSLENPIECYEALNNRPEFKNLTQEEKTEDEVLSNKFKNFKTYLEKSSKEFSTLYKLIKTNLQLH